MTKDEAIEILKGKIYPYNYKKNKMIISNVNEENEALDVVKDLCVKQVPSVNPQPCDDAVSRDALIAKLTELIKTSRSTIEIKAKLIPMIQGMPSVTPSRPRGHWIIYNYPGHECVYCSNCKEEYYEDDLYMGGSDFPKYCPNCGAEME